MKVPQIREGFVAYRLPAPSTMPFKERLRRNEDMLSRCLNIGTTVAVLGAGCSKPLGYPLWDELALEVLGKTIADRRLAAEHRTSLKDLERVLEAGSSTSEQKTYALGLCQSLLGELDDREPEGRTPSTFQKILAGFCKRPRKNRSNINPYTHLLKLPIRRFVTTNYDLEIEHALARARKVSKEKLGLEGDRPVSDPLSITQENRYLEQLTRFSFAGISSNEDMVFHCHGRCNRPESIIASEYDYQQWYLASRGEEGVAFRHSIDLLFSSNPLLFIGYGFGDEDLLRPLRVLRAQDPIQKDSRPIFMLTGFDEDDEEEKVKANVLFERYGVHVIRYAKNKRRADFGLSGALKDVHERWQAARTTWGRKPPPRMPLPFPPQTKGLHTNVDLGEPMEVPARILPELPAKVLESGHRVIGLIGPSGCGKTWHAIRLVKNFQEEEAEAERDGKERSFPEGIFYWNAHYANEVFTSLDRLDRFLRRCKKSVPGTIYKRLEESLKEKECLIVIDGTERFLRATERPFVGEANTRDLERLFEILGSKGNLATVLLVGRLWPQIYVQRNGEPSRAEQDLSLLEQQGPPELVPTLIQMPLEPVHESEATAFWVEIMGQGSPTLDLKTQFSALSALLEGHNFALRIAFELIKSSRSKPRRAREIRRLLEGSRPDRRVASIVRAMLDELNQKSSGLAEPFLLRLAMSLNAVHFRTLELCWNLACTSTSTHGRKAEERKKVLDFLHGLRLLVKMPRVLTDGVAGEPTYTLHSGLRELFHARRRGLPADNLPTFSLAGMASGGFDIDPRQEGAEHVIRLLRSILGEAEAATKKGKQPEAIDLCRDAYGVLRARMSATTVSRWGTFRDYASLGLQLIHVAKSINPRRNWGPRDSDDLWKLEKSRAPLYLAELTWLYNDVAVAMACEGMIYDAVPTFMLANELARMIEPSDKGGGYRIQVLLNLAHTMLERGQLRAADRYLQQASYMNASHGDPDLKGRLIGYGALVHHLRGNLKNADEGYMSCLEQLKDTPNIRARSYFYRRWGDLLLQVSKIESKRLEQAELNIRSALILAGEGYFPDLEIEAQISEGALLEARGDLASARLTLNRALARAGKIGSRRLKAEALCRLAGLALRQGDLDGARRNATHALRISNACGLGLCRTHSLLTLGRATVEAGQWQLGAAYLRQAYDLADRQQYWLRLRDAEREIDRLESIRGSKSLVDLHR